MAKQDSPDNRRSNTIKSLRKIWKKQLRIFVQLRGSIENQFEEIMESLSKYFKEENNFLFKKGELKGELKGKVKKMAFSKKT